MNTYNQLISKARLFYNDKKFDQSKACLLDVLNNFELETKVKLNIYWLLAEILHKLNEFKDAERYLVEFIRINPQNSKALNFLANNYYKSRNYENAEKFYLRAIKYDQNNETAIINLAILYENLGRNIKSIKYYQQALKINPTNMGVLYNISRIDSDFVLKNYIVLIEDYIKLENKDNLNLAAAFFLLAANEKKKNNINKEISYLKKANHYSFKYKEKINNQTLEYWLNIIPKKIEKINYIHKKNFSLNTKNIYPIFIVGLPRSGSTLTETIISSGKIKIEDFGETNLVNWALLNTNRSKLFNHSKNNGVFEIDYEATAKKLYDSFSNLNISINKEKIFILEKSLENFFYIELILKVFPNAKFIHTYRNLSDNIFAIYKQFLSEISWSHSLDNILNYIDNYLNILKKQKKKFSEKIFSVSLENLTQNPRDLSKEIYKFCNLEWDENCLNFHKRDNLFLKTASNNQIRTSVQMYDNKKYNSYKEILNEYQKKYDWI